MTHTSPHDDGSLEAFPTYTTQSAKAEIEKFNRWLRDPEAEPTYAYYRGLRQLSEVRAQESNGKYMPVEPWHSLANRVWEAYEAGHILPVQVAPAFGRRHWAYLACKTKKGK